MKMPFLLQRNGLLAGDYPSCCCCCCCCCVESIPQQLLRCCDFQQLLQLLRGCMQQQCRSKADCLRRCELPLLLPLLLLLLLPVVDEVYIHLSVAGLAASHSFRQGGKANTRRRRHGNDGETLSYHRLPEVALTQQHP